jgi:hypothetical protein
MQWGIARGGRSRVCSRAAVGFELLEGFAVGLPSALCCGGGGAVEWRLGCGVAAPPQSRLLGGECVSPQPISHAMGPWRRTRAPGRTMQLLGYSQTRGAMEAGSVSRAGASWRPQTLNVESGSRVRQFEACTRTFSRACCRWQGGAPGSRGRPLPTGEPHWARQCGGGAARAFAHGWELRIRAPQSLAAAHSWGAWRRCKS